MYMWLTQVSKFTDSLQLFPSQCKTHQSILQYISLTSDYESDYTEMIIIESVTPDCITAYKSPSMASEGETVIVYCPEKLSK